MLAVFKRCYQNILPVIATATVCLLIISKSGEASSGIINGLKICSGVIIPSLFPFMVFSAFVIKSGTYIKIGKIIGRPINLAFNLPRCSSGAVIMGFLGGYPIGISMTSELLKLGAIEKREAKRLALFSVNAGPAFVISAVGGVIYQSKNIGIILFASVVLSSLTIGIFMGIYSRIKGEKATEKTILKSNTTIPVAFVSATESAARAILSICVWVVTFSAVISFVKLLSIPNEASILLCGALEVTSGCSMSVGVLPIGVTAALISFSGFCIFFQILPHLKNIGIKFSVFFLSRIVCAILSFIYCTALTKIFPCSSEVFSNSVTPLAKSFSISIPTTICLILTCVVLIFEVDRKKKIC